VAVTRPTAAPALPMPDPVLACPEPPGLPDGKVDLRLADADDDLSEAELAHLNEALQRGFEAVKAGRFRPAQDVIADLRHRLR
jgi:hypothetical protein